MKSWAQLACQSSYEESVNRRVMVQVSSGRNMKPYVKTKAKRADSVSQMQSPEFYTQYHQKRKGKRKTDLF
jgi:hypothetical protein